jgi:hypothetical protein
MRRIKLAPLNPEVGCRNLKAHSSLKGGNLKFEDSEDPLKSLEEVKKPECCTEVVKGQLRLGEEVQRGTNQLGSETCCSEGYRAASSKVEERRDV